MAEAELDPSLSSETLGNSARVASATAFNAVVSGASTIIVARALGTSKFGLYTYWIFLLILIAGLSDLGVNTRGTNILVRAWASGETKTVAAEMRRMLRLNVARALILGVGTTVVFRAHPAAAALITTAVMLRAVSAVFSISLVARRRYRALAMSSIGTTIAQSIATSWVAVATHDAALTVAVFVVGQLIDVAVAFALAPWPLLRKASQPATRLQRLQLRTLLAFYSLGLCQLVIFGRSESLVLHQTDQAVALGLFAIATTLAARATLLTDALYSALVPSLGAASTRDHEGAARAYSTALRFSSLLVLLTALVLGPAIVVVGPVVLGASGGAVRVATAVILGGSLLQTFVYPLTAIASLEMQRRAVAFPALVGAVLDIGAALILIPGHGLSGAAVASLIGALGFAFGFCTIVRLRGPTVQTLRAQLLRVITMIAALIAAGIATQNASAVIAFAAIWATTITVYFLCGAGHGVLTGEDLTRLRAAAPRLAIRVPRAARGYVNRALLVASDGALVPPS